MRTSGWMKRQPLFWPIKRFIKRISGKELWLKTEVEHLRTLGYQIFAISETGRELGFVLKSDG